MRLKLLCGGFSLLLYLFCISGIDIPGLESGSCYVSPSGSDNNPGTIAQPFKTVQKGCDSLKPGDTLYIREGEYNEKIVMNTSGRENAYITVRPFGEDRVVLNGAGVKAKSCIIYIRNKSYIRIKGLVLCNSLDGDTPSGILVEGYGDGIEISGNKVHSVQSDSNAHGIAVYGTNGARSVRGITIQGNEIYDCRLGASESVVVNGNVKNFRICGNVIHDNNNIGIDCIGFEKTAPLNDRARSGLVAGNTVYNISSAGNPVYYGDACAGGIYIDGGKDIVVERNTVYNCDIGIEVASEHYDGEAENITVRNNLICYNNTYGFSLGGASRDNGYAKNCVFSNNTLYNNNTGINIQKSRNNKVSSNIICDSGRLMEGAAGSNSFGYNLWYSAAGNRQGLVKFADPGFINPLKFDFRLEKDSPAINAGDPRVTIYDGETDLSGGPRIQSGRIDCGAFEYDGD